MGLSSLRRRCGSDRARVNTYSSCAAGRGGFLDGVAALVSMRHEAGRWVRLVVSVRGNAAECARLPAAARAQTVRAGRADLRFCRFKHANVTLGILLSECCRRRSALHFRRVPILSTHSTAIHSTHVTPGVARDTCTQRQPFGACAAVNAGTTQKVDAWCVLRKGEALQCKPRIARARESREVRSDPCASAVNVTSGVSRACARISCAQVTSPAAGQDCRAPLGTRDIYRNGNCCCSACKSSDTNSELKLGLGRGRDLLLHVLICFSRHV